MTRKFLARENGIPVQVDESEFPTKVSQLENDSGYTTKGEVAAGYVAKTGDNAGVTLADDQTITGAKTFTTAVTVNGAITAGGRIKAPYFTADNGVNKNFDFRDAHDSKGGGWVLSSDSHPSGQWATIATTDGAVARANVAGSAESVNVANVAGLNIGATTFSDRGGGSYGATVRITRDAYGRITGLSVTSANCSSDCSTD